MAENDPTEREWLEGLRYEDKFPSPQGEDHDSCPVHPLPDPHCAICCSKAPPVSGTQGENHEAVPCRHDWSPFNDPYCTRCGSHKDDVVPSPVSGTEPDTAKRVREIADFIRNATAAQLPDWRGPNAQDRVADAIERRFLTGFSADATDAAPPGWWKAKYEADTAKLVEAARWYVECRERYFRREPVSGLDEAWEGLRSALARFSVDAGKSEEER